MRCLCTGVLVRAPERKTAANGNAYAKAMVRIDAHQRQEGDPDSLLIFAVAFGDAADSLLELKQGDSIAFAGKLDVRATLYQGKPQATCNVAIDKLIDGKRPSRPQRRDSPPATPLAAASPTRADIFDDGTVGAMNEDVPFG